MAATADDGGIVETAGLTEGELELIRGVLRKHHEVTDAILFGSRAKGNASRASDIDLALNGRVDPLEAESIAGELDELPLPYQFDVVAFQAIRSEPLREHVERVGIRIYCRA